MSSGRQYILPLAHELVVDLFAGGGGASAGTDEPLGTISEQGTHHAEVQA